MRAMGMPLGDARAIATLAGEVRELMNRAASEVDRKYAAETLETHAETIAEAERLVRAVDGDTARRR